MAQNRYLTQEEIREVGKDIRYIKTGIKIKNQKERPYLEPLFYLLFPIPFIVFILSVLYRFQSSRQKEMLHSKYAVEHSQPHRKTCCS